MPSLMKACLRNTALCMCVSAWSSLQPAVLCPQPTDTPVLLLVRCCAAAATCTGAPTGVQANGAVFSPQAWAAACGVTPRGSQCSTTNACAVGTGNITALCGPTGDWVSATGICTGKMCSSTAAAACLSVSHSKCHCISQIVVQIDLYKHRLSLASTIAAKRLKHCSTCCIAFPLRCCMQPPVRVPHLGWRYWVVRRFLLTAGTQLAALRRVDHPALPLAHV
jgi:hypothetical protein